MAQKFLVQCKHCGRILFKTPDPFIRSVIIEIVCPDCKRVLKLPGDANIDLGREKRPGLEEIRPSGTGE